MKKLMNSEPTIETRNEQPYLSIHAKAAMDEISTTVDKLFPEIFQWMGARGIEWAGVPFIRYTAADPNWVLDMEIGVPVAAAQTGDDRVQPGIFPAGRYAKLIHTGPYDDMKQAHQALLEWGEKQGIQWAVTKSEAGEQWKGRTEFYPTNPMAEPDQSKWITEILYLIAD